jgi:hypothetical protein
LLWMGSKARGLMSYDVTVCKKTLASVNKMLARQNSHFFIHSSYLLPHDCWQNCQRALVDESGVFPRQHHLTMVLHVHILLGGWTISQLVDAVQRRSLTPIDTSNRSMIKTSWKTVHICNTALTMTWWRAKLITISQVLILVAYCKLRLVSAVSCYVTLFMHIMLDLWQQNTSILLAMAS